MSLFAGSARKATMAATSALIQSKGLAKTDGEKILKDLTDKIFAFAEPLHLDSRELRDVSDVVLHHLYEVASGKSTAEKTNRWAEAALADLKTRHGNMKRVRQVIADANDWLAREYPDVHAALKDSKGLGNHPQLVRKLTDRFLAHEAEQARRKHSASAKPAVSASIPPGGLLAGNPSGKVAASALRSLNLAGGESDAT